MVTRNSIAAISIFSGCGGLDIGCEMAGVPVLCCLDNDPECIATLRANDTFKKAEIYHADITSFPIKKFDKLIRQSNSTKAVVIGGPPCQPFSKAGYWVGHASRKGIHDDRNMINEFLRIIHNLKPDGFLFENVESLLHPVNSIVVETMVSYILKLGYRYKLLRTNALDYGVPQKRKRVFIIGTKSRFKSNEPIRTHCSYEESGSLGLLPYENVGEHIKQFDSAEYFENSEITANGRYAKELERIPPGRNYFALTARDGYPNPKFKAGTRFWSFLLKLHPEIPSWTIAAQPGPWTGPFHWTSRRLRAPEIAAIQTFPHDYKFMGSRRSLQKQVGNAVPPLMGKAMIEFLKENL